MIHDRDSIFSRQIDKQVSNLGVRVLRTPIRAPRANAVCERLGGSLRRECLDFLIPLSQRHLKTTISGDYLSGYDIVVRRALVFHVAGRVVDERGEPAAGAVLQMPSARERVTADQDGKFEWARVRPGDAVAQADWRRGDASLRGFAPVTVQDHDIENITVRVAPPVVVSGAAELDGKPAQIEGAASLEPVDGYGSRARASFGASGIHFDAVYPGRYRLQVQVHTDASSNSVTDDGLPAGSTISVTWSKVSGPGDVTFQDPRKAATTAAFSVEGTYVLKLAASDSEFTIENLATVTVLPRPAVTQGWIGSPADRALVTGVVPVTVAAGVTLTGGTLSYWPAADESKVTVLNANTTGSGTLGSIDTTVLVNGAYWLRLEATDSTGKTQNNLALVTVGGDYRPGRVTTTVTDLVVPAPGLPIRIERTYDSLVRQKSGDFGYGWSLGVNAQLETSPNNDLMLTINGQRRTFYFTPVQQGLISIFYDVAYTAEPGPFTCQPPASARTKPFDACRPNGMSQMKDVTQLCRASNSARS